MRLKNIPGSREVIAENDYVIHDEQAHKGKWNEVFGNDKPIRLEIGAGKGRFLMDLAARDTDYNFLGIEKYSSVLLRALQKMEEEPLDNLRFIRMDAEYIGDSFAPGEIDRIYLNFSDPWPKDRHAKRRLPSHQFLARYAQILKPGGLVEFKTDNRGLFDFALEEIKESSFELLLSTFDLHADSELMKDNIMTEYEERFSSMGNPICKYVIKLRS